MYMQNLIFSMKTWKKALKIYRGLLAVLPADLYNLQMDIDAAIRNMLIVLEDITFLEQHLNLKLIYTNLENSEKEEIKLALEESQLFYIPPAKEVKANSK